MANHKFDELFPARASHVVTTTVNEQFVHFYQYLCTAPYNFSIFQSILKIETFSEFLVSPKAVA